MLDLQSNIKKRKKNQAAKAEIGYLRLTHSFHNFCSSPNPKLGILNDIGNTRLYVNIDFISFWSDLD